MMGSLPRLDATSTELPFFQCLTLSKDVSDLASLAAIAVDTDLSLFDEKFLVDICLI
jgi:hypothetical protein